MDSAHSAAAATSAMAGIERRWGVSPSGSRACVQAYNSSSAGRAGSIFALAPRSPSSHMLQSSEPTIKIGAYRPLSGEANAVPSKAQYSVSCKAIVSPYSGSATPAPRRCIAMAFPAFRALCIQPPPSK